MSCEVSGVRSLCLLTGTGLVGMYDSMSSFRLAERERSIFCPPDTENNECQNVPGERCCQKQQAKQIKYSNFAVKYSLKSSFETLMWGTKLQHDEVIITELFVDWLVWGLYRKCDVREAVTALFSFDLFLDPFLLGLFSGRVSTATANAHLQTSPQRLTQTHTNSFNNTMVAGELTLRDGIFDLLWPGQDSEELCRPSPVRCVTSDPMSVFHEQTDTEKNRSALHLKHIFTSVYCTCSPPYSHFHTTQSHPSICVLEKSSLYFQSQCRCTLTPT